MSSVKHVGLNNKDYSPERTAVDMKELFEEMITILKKIEYHLYLATDTDLGED